MRAGGKIERMLNRELEANLQMLARQHPGQRLSPELRVIAVIREAEAAAD